MELTHEFVLRARLDPPLAFGAGLRGDRIFCRATEGTVDGDRIHYPGLFEMNARVIEGLGVGYRVARVT